MKSHMYLGAALEDRLGWTSFPTSSSEERDTFNAMCVAWSEYERRQVSEATVRARGFPKGEFPSSPIHRSQDDAEATLRKRVAPGHPLHDHQAHSHTHLPNSNGQPAADRSLRRKSAPGRPASPFIVEGTPASHTHAHTHSHPAFSPPVPPMPLSAEDKEAAPRSRTGRIFVAWKA